MKRRPNFLFILADDLGWADLSCYGNQYIETPVIDALAATGMRFTDAYAAAPLCQPTRASTLCGQYPSRTGIYDVPCAVTRRPWARLIPPPHWGDRPRVGIAMAELLGPAGYACAHIGKKHEPLAFRAGFEAEDSCDSVELAPHVGESLADEISRFSEENPGKKAGLITERAIRFMTARRDQPFLCFVAHHLVHVPLDVRGDLKSGYEEKWDRCRVKIHPHYAAMCQVLDESVGLMLRALDALDLMNDTVVILFSDNGGCVKVFHTGEGPYVTCNDPLRNEKGAVYEGGIRVPFITSWPGRIQPGSVCRTPVNSIDFLPTIAEIAGVQLPADAVVDGMSIAPLLTQGSAPQRDSLFWYYPGYHHSTPAAAVRRGDFKLHRFFEGNRTELYNLADDICERRDLAIRMPEKAAALREELDRWLEGTGGRIPVPNPEFDPRRELVAEIGQDDRFRYIPPPWPPQPPQQTVHASQE